MIFRSIKLVLITLFSFVRKIFSFVRNVKYITLSNQPCLTKLTLIGLSPDDCYYLFLNSLDRWKCITFL